MNAIAREMDFSWKLTQTLLISAILILIPSVLLAQTAQNSAVGGMICYIADNFLGNAGRGIATIGISVLGVGAILGRITWIQAMIVGVGVAVLFGAPAIAVSLGAWGVCP